MAVQAVWCEPVSGSRSLICWEDTGNSSGARLLGGAIRPDAASSRGHTGMFPESGNREIRDREHGFSRRESSSCPGVYHLRMENSGRAKKESDIIVDEY